MFHCESIKFKISGVQNQQDQDRLLLISCCLFDIVVVFSALDRAESGRTGLRSPRMRILQHI